ncbi:hypothetical protein N7463_006810 [Penicillium fimorum]|uniref:Uncharacterized protein n=1 Tax=Penicillium fimorum TaxID=1882269 RepID=A0A9W9XW06_9EURO|nr:hypothetical protein N7463_006810 [Penicillium fimorum]
MPEVISYQNSCDRRGNGGNGQGWTRDFSHDEWNTIVPKTHFEPATSSLHKLVLYGPYAPIEIEDEDDGSPRRAKLS